MDANGVANLIQKAQNIVTVVVRAPNGRADLVSSMVWKERAETRVGVALTESRGKVVIAKIAEDGLFAHTLLNVGDTCLSINGIKITPDMDANASAALIRTSPASVTVKAKTKRESGVVVAATKDSRAEMGSAALSSRGSACFSCLFFMSIVTIIVVRQVVFGRKQ
jgi:predicted metalloprotease with PDZ domain